MPRPLRVSALLLALAVPTWACINDGESQRQEQRFRERYEQEVVRGPVAHRQPTVLAMSHPLGRTATWVAPGIGVCLVAVCIALAGTLRARRVPARGQRRIRLRTR